VLTANINMLNDTPRQHIKKQRHYFGNIIFPAVIDVRVGP